MTEGQVLSPWMRSLEESGLLTKGGTGNEGLVFHGDRFPRRGSSGDGLGGWLSENSEWTCSLTIG